MSKIKLSILLLIKISLVSCTSNIGSYDYKTSVAYVDGEYDGLVLSNKLKSHLNNFGMFDENSNFEIQAISQFYVLASSDQFISNSTAVEEIKFENTEYLVRKLVNSLSEGAFVCDEQK